MKTIDLDGRSVENPAYYNPSVSNRLEQKLERKSI